MKPPSPPGKKLITRCPFCGDELSITRLSCAVCSTQIDSHLEIPIYFRLPPDLQDFVLIFLRCQGKIRDVEKELGISYPTVCKRLDLVNELLNFCRAHLSHQKCPRSIDFEAELPRLPTGKLYKRVLRDRYWGDRRTRIV